MIIVTDCLTEQPAEGCLKIANSLIKRIKKLDPRTTIISYGKTTSMADRHMRLNKLFLNWSLLFFISKRKETVLYIPNASCTRASAIRVWVMSRVVRKPVKVVFVQWHGMDRLTKYLLRSAGAQIVCLSQESVDRYSTAGLNAVYMQTGVDLQKYKPVSEQQRQDLRRKYQILQHEKVILHVGHLKEGRNLDKLYLLDKDFHVIVVVSSVTSAESSIQNFLQNCKNITLIQTYIEHIEELYQLADAYFFPVLASENCIDVPLSVLEAAACELPVLTTPYGELQTFYEMPGFRFLKNFDAEKINDTLNELILERNLCKNRDMVRLYDWQNAVRRLLEE